MGPSLRRTADRPDRGAPAGGRHRCPACARLQLACQLRVAPYSYDWLDNLGRRSPRRRDPSLEQLERGQRFLPFSIVDFEPGSHITGLALPRARLIFGPMALTYAVRPRPDGGSHLVMKLNVGADGFWQRLRLSLFQWGDVVMARKQLLTLKSLAELEAREGAAH